MIDLSPQHGEIVREILSRYFAGCRVRVFGSRAKGASRPASDLDIAVTSCVPIPLIALAKADEDFADSDLPFRVDLIDTARVSEQFRAIIDRDGIELSLA